MSISLWRHCNTLQHAATHCNTLQHTATHCNIDFKMRTRRSLGRHCNTLQHAAAHCNSDHKIRTRRFLERHCNTPQYTATPYNSLQLTATLCNSMQLTATYTTRFERADHWGGIVQAAPPTSLPAMVHPHVTRLSDVTGLIHTPNSTSCNGISICYMTPSYAT